MGQYLAMLCQYYLSYFSWYYSTSGLHR